MAKANEACAQINTDPRGVIYGKIVYDIKSQKVYEFKRRATLHKKWNFLLRISSVNVTKSAQNCGFGHIYWRNPKWKTSFFVQWKQGCFNIENDWLLLIFLLWSFMTSIYSNISTETELVAISTVSKLTRY